MTWRRFAALCSNLSPGSAWAHHLRSTGKVKPGRRISGAAVDAYFASFPKAG